MTLITCITNNKKINLTFIVHNKESDIDYMIYMVNKNLRKI